MNTRWDKWPHVDPDTPVIVGIGTATQHVTEPGGGDDALQLMLTAVREAGTDSGSPSLLQRVDLVSVPGGTWPYADPGRLIATSVGSPDARTVLMTAGIPQQTLLNEAFLDVQSKRIEVALIVGGEATFRAVNAKRADVALDDERYDVGEPDDLRRPTGEMVTAAEVAAKVYAPAQMFALIDSALRAAEGRTIDQHRDEIAALWAGFSAVAGQFSEAAFREPKPATFLREPGPENRPIAFPYNKWHCSQMNVDQAAAILICSWRTAQSSGVNPDNVVFPLVALESSFSVPLPRRRDLHRWPAMELVGARAADHLGSPLSALEHIELYSCFPAAVRVQQRALGLPLDSVPTVTGGEPFAGGPWNNFVLQSTVAMIRLVRRDRNARGMVTSVSGFLNKPGLAVYSSEPGHLPLLVADLAAQAEQATPTVGIAEGYRGPATVVAYTVSYERAANRVLVIADTPSHERCVAYSTDASLADRVTEHDLIGQKISINGVEFTL